MDIKLLATVFTTVFLAELGDKTQLATLLFAARGQGALWSVFIGAALALVLATAIGVVAGGWLSQWIQPRLLTMLAGGGFVLIGLWTFYSGWSATSV